MRSEHEFEATHQTEYDRWLGELNAALPKDTGTGVRGEEER